MHFYVLSELKGIRYDYKVMTEMIQGYKTQTHINSIDFDKHCSHFATGGKDSIKIFDFNLHKDCWFQTKKSIGKYKGATITKACVSQLAWNKEGREALAIGTTSGLVSVYDAEAPFKNLMLCKGHEGNIKNIEWNPGSRDRFISASFENEIIEWDIRQENKVNKYEFSEYTKIRDVKFSPHRPELLAVQSSSKLELLDIRKGMETLSTYQIHSNEMQGIGVQWDPIHPSRIASAISKKICVFDISSGIFEFVEGLSHYSLIKEFYWMKNKPTFFGILGEHPEKNLFFYDLEDKNRMAYMYGGHQKSIDCWKMNTDQTILLSVSNHRDTRKTGVSQANNQYAFLIAQHTDNYFDPNESKFNYPLTFDNDSNIAFCLNMETSSARKSSLQVLKKRNSKNYQTAPAIYQFKDTTDLYQIDKDISFPMTLKEEILFLDKQYKIEDNKEESNERIAHHNSEVALKIGKFHCAQVWKNLFQISFPPEEEEVTLEAIYERKLKLNISIIDNRVILCDKKNKCKTPHKIEIASVIQWLIDEHNELQTAALAVVCLFSRDPNLLPQDFIYRVFTPYIELLRCLELFEIAAKTVLMTKSKKYTQITENGTKFTVQCGSCKSSVTKGDCKCNLLCVICQGRLSEGLVIWCKYCGHGGHARDYQKWFKVDQKKYCPHGCGHACFSVEQEEK